MTQFIPSYWYYYTPACVPANVLVCNGRTLIFSRESYTYAIDSTRRKTARLMNQIMTEHLPKE